MHDVLGEQAAARATGYDGDVWVDVCVIQPNADVWAREQATVSERGGCGIEGTAINQTRRISGNVSSSERPGPQPHNKL